MQIRNGTQAKEEEIVTEKEKPSGYALDSTENGQKQGNFGSFRGVVHVDKRNLKILNFSS